MAATAAPERENSPGTVRVQRPFVCTQNGDVRSLLVINYGYRGLVTVFPGIFAAWFVSSPFFRVRPGGAWGGEDPFELPACFMV